MPNILVVEDIQSLREVLVSVLETEGYHVTSVADAESALTSFRTNAFDGVLTDYRLPRLSGIDLIREIRAYDTAIPILMMTAYGSIDVAVEAMKAGASDFMLKPFEPARLCASIEQVLSHHRIIDRSGSGSRGVHAFISQEPAIQELLTQATRVASFDSTVLILGESGTGKELLARHIHERSQRRGKPFVAINCAAMPESLLESEFFGHEAGAFTGATQARQGLFEYASEGTIFLDEVGDMPRALQVKLLRALQEREIKRIGGTRTIRTAPRIIAATNKNIEQALESGELREDFYYRLAVMTFTVPPLRERPSDIGLLAEHFVNKFSLISGKPLSLSDPSAALLSSYHWPGNVRELENVIERASILAEGEILPSHLGLKGIELRGLAAPQSLVEVAQRAAKSAEIELLNRTLLLTKGNKSRAAQIVGVSYKTLLNKVREHGLCFPPVNAHGPDLDGQDKGAKDQSLRDSAAHTN
jgi:DNA-binding NtrC family response regulator